MEVEESAGSLRVVIDALDEPILMIAPDHSIRFMNRAAQQFAGVHPDAKNELFCHEVSHNLPAPCDDPSQLCPLRETRKTREPLTLPHVHPGVAGTRRHLEIVSSPIWNDEGQFLGIVQSARDVTDRNAVEKGRPFNCAILDLTVQGGMGGIEALGKLRECDPAVRVIASSGHAADPVMADFRRYRFANALAKPQRTDQLAPVLQKTLSEQ